MIKLLPKEKLDRINYLAKKSKEIGLTNEEKIEQQRLREEYIKFFRKSFRQQLESIKIVRQ